MSKAGSQVADVAKRQAKKWVKKAVAAKVGVVAVPVIAALIAVGLILSVIVTRAQIAAEQETRDLRGVMASEAITPDVLKIYAEVGAETSVPWHVLAAIAEVETRHGSMVPGDPTVRSPDSDSPDVALAPIVSPPIDVTLDGRRYVGPFLIDAEVLAESEDGADINPNSIADAATFLAGLLNASLERDAEYLPDMSFGNETQRDVWLDALSQLPVYQSTFTPPPAPTEPTCPTAVVYGDGLLSSASAADPLPGVTMTETAGATFMDVVASIVSPEPAPEPEPSTDPTAETAPDTTEPAPPPPADSSALMVVSAGFHGWGDFTLLPGVTSGAEAMYALMDVAPVGRLVVITPPETDPARPIGTAIRNAAEAIPDLQVTVVDGAGWITDASTQIDPATGLTAEAGTAYRNWVFNQFCERGTDPIVVPPAPFAERVLTFADAYRTGSTPQCGSGAISAAAGPAQPMIVDRAVYDTILSTYAAGETVEPRTPTPEERVRMMAALAAGQQAGFAGDRLVVIVSLAGRESRWMPDAYNGNRATGDDSYGLLQINTIQQSVWSLMSSELGFSAREDLYDPVNNMRAARWLYDRSAATPFFAWGPYRGDQPLHLGAEDWVQAVLAVATEEGFLDASGNPMSGGRSVIAGGCTSSMLSVSPTIDGLLTWAQSMIGTPYAAINPYRFGTQLWPGGSLTSDFIDRTYNFPAGTRVFDCSGFVITAFRQIGVDLPSLGGYDSQSIGRISALPDVDRSSIMPGDIIVYSPLNGIGHVVISMGGEQVIDASPRGVGIRSIDWTRVSAIKRVDPEALGVPIEP